MTRPLHMTLLATALFALAGIAQAADGAKTASVNGKQIPATRVDALVAAQVAQGQPDSPNLRTAVLEELVRREVIAQEAAKKGFDKKPEVVQQLALTQQGVLIGAYLQDFVKTHPVTDDMLKTEYDKLKKTLGDKEYKARHILLDNEEAAKAVVAKLKGGAKFEDLAKESKDPGSAERGGDLGWSNKASYVKPFADAMMALEKGKFTETPVKSDFGYHVIQLEDVRDMKVPTLDEIKPQLTQRMQQAIVEKHVADLRAKAKVQ
jgi:peptidyl-prolyl cis-trans isomerase C